MKEFRHFSSEDFLEDLQIAIKDKYGTLQNYAAHRGIHRNTLSAILNNPEKMSPNRARSWAREFGMDLRYYFFD